MSPAGPARFLSASTSSRLSYVPPTRRVLQLGRGLVPKRCEARADELDCCDHRDRDHGEGDRVLREVLPAFIPNQPPGECHVSPFRGTRSRASARRSSPGTRDPRVWTVARSTPCPKRT